MARRKGSVAGRFRRMWVRSCRGCLLALQEEFSFLFILHMLKTREGCDRGSEVGIVHRFSAPTSRLLNVLVRSPLLYPRGGPKWRDNYPRGPTIRSPPIVWNQFSSQRVFVVANSCNELTMTSSRSLVLFSMPKFYNVFNF